MQLYAGDGMILAKGVGGTELVFDALVFVDVACDGDIAKSAFLLELFVKVGSASALHEDDLALNIGYVCVGAVFDILEAADNAFVGSVYGLADADNGICFVFGLEHFKGSGVDGHNVHLKVFDNRGDARFFAVRLDDLSCL